MLGKLLGWKFLCNTIAISSVDEKTVNQILELWKLSLLTAKRWGKCSGKKQENVIERTWSPVKMKQKWNGGGNQDGDWMCPHVTNIMAFLCRPQLGDGYSKQQPSIKG